MTSAADFDVSRETLERLRAYQALVEKWNPTINLISKGDVGEIWQRHILDSLQIPALKLEYSHWVDIGSGGGFPGLVIAICALENAPEATHTLIESDLRKSTFLRTVIRELGLNAKVLQERIENVRPLEADVVSARALASLDLLCEFSARHLGPEGKAVFLKGRTVDQEIEQAKNAWTFELRKVPSKTDPEAAIVILEGIERV